MPDSMVQIIFYDSLINFVRTLGEKETVVTAGDFNGHVRRYTQHEDKKLAWKSYHEKLLNTNFTWDRNSLSYVDAIGIVHCLIDKSMARESINNIKDGQVAGLSDVVLEMVKARREAGFDTITDLVNQIIVEGVTPVE